VSLFRNTGSRQAPELAAAVQLVPPGAAGGRAEAPKEARRGTRSKICVADWNGDGRLDLLVGDLATQKPDRPEAAPEEQAKYAQIRKELEPLQKRWSEVYQRLYGSSRTRDKDERNKLMEEWQKVNEQMTPLREQLPREYENHGWVWLFLRK
jgi:hypothetical protein